MDEKGTGTRSDTRNGAEERECLLARMDGTRPVSETMIHETSVQILINGQPLIRTQCLARELDCMAVGYVRSLGMLQHRDQLIRVMISPSGDSANVITAGTAPPADPEGVPLIRGTGGGTFSEAGRQPGTPASRIQSPFAIDLSRLLSIAQTYNTREGNYRASRFVHSAALSDGERILCFFEDVGRHNAVDKALGWGFMQQYDFSRTMLLCSGRFSVEMVLKAAAAGIPVYCAPAAASIEAMELAQQLDMCLCGRLSSDSATVYSASWRITGK